MNDGLDPSVGYVEFSVDQPVKKHHLLNGVLLSFRNMSQILTLLTLASNPVAHVAIVLMIEVGYFAHYLISNIKVSLSLRITEILTEVFIISIMSMTLLVNIGAVTEESRYGIVSILMVVCVYGIIIVSSAVGQLAGLDLT